jgi:menaquinone-dependent protoporphyrinogen oxidase
MHFLCRKKNYAKKNRNNMRTLILFATHHGTTQKVANSIASRLGKEDVTLHNLKNKTLPDLSRYERIIIGGSIHAGNIQKRVRDFCKTHMVDLLEKPLGLFLCCMNQPEYEAQFERAWPELLRTHAQSCKIMGGEFLMERMNFLERAIVRKITGRKETIRNIYEEKIDELVAEIRQSE